MGNDISVAVTPMGIFIDGPNIPTEPTALATEMAGYSSIGFAGFGLSTVGILLCRFCLIKDSNITAPGAKFLGRVALGTGLLSAANFGFLYHLVNKYRI